MKNQKKNYASSDAILKMLSDEEVAKVSTAESAVHMSAGDEYLDLTNPQAGVRRASGTDEPLGRFLMRKSVHAKTWSKILATLPRQSAQRSER
jgi:hypothetical protein